MAAIISPAPLEVLNLTNLTAQALRKESVEAILVDIGDDLTGITALLNVDADQWAAPFDFPFTTAVMLSAYPGESPTQRMERAEEQMTLLSKAAAYKAAASLHDRITTQQNVSFASDGSSGKSARFEALFGQFREAARISITATASRATAADVGLSDDDGGRAERLANNAARSVGGSVAQDVVWIS